MLNIVVHNTLFKDLWAAAVVTCSTQFSGRSSCIIGFCIKFMVMDVHIYHIIHYIHTFQPISKNNVIVVPEITYT